MIELDARVTHLFFDRKAAQDKVAAGRRRALSKAGAWVRQRAKTRLRRRKGPSAAGEPPHVHAEDWQPNLKTILFAWDPAAETVVVGPVKLNQVVGVRGGSIRVPTLLEFGGTALVKDGRYQDGKWVSRVRSARYRPRPFMGPALEHTLPRLPESCRDMLSPTAATAVPPAF